MKDSMLTKSEDCEKIRHLTLNMLDAHTQI